MKMLWNVCVWAIAVFACGVAFGSPPLATDKESARSASDFALFCDAWSRPIGHDARKQLVQAAVSRDDFVNLALAALVKSPEDKLRFLYNDILGERWRPDVVEKLKQLASDTTVNRSARFASISALESLAGPTFEPDFDADYELRAKAIVDWFDTNGPPVIVAHNASAAATISGCIEKMAEQMRQDRSLKGNAFDAEYNCIQLTMHWLEFSIDSASAAPYLVEHLKGLHSLPTASPPDRLDETIGLLQYQVLRALENHVGPISGLERDHDERASIEPILAEVLAWWPTAKDLSPTQWRMQRLRDRGYKTETTEPGPTIGTELLRAIQSGTSAEAFTASTLLKSFDLCHGTVAYKGTASPNEKNRTDSALTDAFIRGLVASDAAARMMQGRFPTWDAESKAWIVKQVKEDK